MMQKLSGTKIIQNTRIDSKQAIFKGISVCFLQVFKTKKIKNNINWNLTRIGYPAQAKVITNFRQNATKGV